MAWSSSGFGFNCSTNNDTEQTVSLNQLSSDLAQTIILGIVIAKQDPRGIPSKKQLGTERYVLNFTIRDSPNDAINAACWGEEAVIKTMNESFMIGDVVKIKNAQIMERQVDLADEKFRPLVNSQYQLNISALYSEVTRFDECRMKYSSLLHYPLHSPSNFLTLADVIYNCQNVDGMAVNLLVAIRDIGKLQDITTKNGKSVKKLQLKVFDQTHPLFTILIWEEAIAHFILKYCSRRSIVFVCDVKVSYNKFVKGMVATATSSTLFTPDPEMPDGRALYQYAQASTIADDMVNNNSFPVDDQMKCPIYTVEQLQKLMNSSELSAFDDTHGTVYACISRLDLDGCSKVTSFRCSCCKQLIRSPQGQCLNGNCAIGAGAEISSPEQQFDLRISLTDHTGSLLKCLLSGQVAQNLFNCTVEQFLKMTDDEKTALKWLNLLERFKVTFKIPQMSIASGNPTIWVTSCTKADPEEVASYYTTML